jgi:molybdopterin converting factor small subunit
MKVMVYAPSFCNLSAVDDDGYLSLEEGSTLNILYKKLKIPLLARPFATCYVNYKPANQNQELKEGDIVSFLTVLAGG